MPLFLPDDIPIAAQNFVALCAKGTPSKLPGYDPSRAFALTTEDETDRCLIWAAPALSSYRSAWNAAHGANLVDDLSGWGSNVDVDHLFPKSWAKHSPMEIAYVRLFPVWAEVNRSAGAGRERTALKDGLANLAPIEGIFYSTELQVLKIIGHPVGTASDPVSIFQR